MKLLQRYIGELSEGRDVTDAAALLDTLNAAEDESQIRDLFQAWNEKGISEADIYSLPRVMRERWVKVSNRYSNSVDVVGTGGSSAKTFKVSTAAEFVVAGAGIPVAKHGTRAATSASGSTDVLYELCIRLPAHRSLAESCI